MLLGWGWEQGKDSPESGTCSSVMPWGCGGRCMVAWVAQNQVWSQGWQEAAEHEGPRGWLRAGGGSRDMGNGWHWG